jgi:hypothetical protein
MSSVLWQHVAVLRHSRPLVHDYPQFG